MLKLIVGVVAVMVFLEDCLEVEIVKAQRKK
jgi:hypothetical protein